MKKYITPLLLIVFTVVLGLQVACSPSLPEDEEEVWFNLGHFDGRSWGQAATDGNWKVYWVSPDRVQEFHRGSYIPKGYLPVEHFANARFPEGKPYNESKRNKHVKHTTGASSTDFTMEQAYPVHSKGYVRN